MINCNTHPTAIIGNNVKIGKNVQIMPYVFIDDNVVIGDDTIIYPFASIGSKAESIKNIDKKSPYFTIIGKNCTIREHVTINCGTENDTIIGDNCYIMTKSHIGHDCIIKNNVTVSCGVKIGGHSIIGDGCNLGLNSVVHQFSEIDDLCMVGACAFFKGRSEKGLIWVGAPAKVLKINLVGLERSTFLSEDIKKNIIENANKFIRKNLT